MTEIYLMRHGETDLNRQRRLQGQFDCPLNDTGREQARQAAVQLAARGIRFDHVWCSTLCRAVETAQIVSGFCRDAICRDPDIMEMSFGPYEGKPFSELPAAMFAYFNDPLHIAVPDGMEPTAALDARTGRFLERLRRCDMGGKLLIVSHGVAITSIVRHLPSGGDEEQRKHPPENCGVYHFVLNNGEYSVPQLL